MPSAKRKSRPKPKAAPTRPQKALAIHKRAEPPRLAEVIEQALIGGDLKNLTVEQRTTLYFAICKSLYINPLTSPFGYIYFKEKEDSEAKLILYAKKDCTDQLRRRDSISTTAVRRWQDGGILFAEASVQNAMGRRETAIGAVPLTGWSQKRNASYELTGRELANAHMRVETKAKRRATLSICGLGIVDESELDTMTTFQMSPKGRMIVESVSEPPPRFSLEEAAADYDASNEHLDKAVEREKRQLDDLRKKNPNVAPVAKLTIVKTVQGAFHADSNSADLDLLIGQFGGTYLRLNRAFLMQEDQLEALKKAARDAGAEIREIDKSEKKAGGGEPPAATVGSSKIGAVAETISGIIGPVNMDIPGRKGKFHTVTIGKKVFYCFSREMAEELSKHRGAEATLEVEGGQYPQIKAIRKVGDKEYDGVKPYLSPADHAQGNLI